MSKYYEVEEIIGKKKIRGKYYYLVKWKGYSLNESTWEPLENLDYANELIEEFNKYIDDKSKNKNKLEKNKNNKIKGSLLNKKVKNENNFSNFYIIDNSIKKILTVKKENNILFSIIEVCERNGKIKREKIDIEDLKFNNPWILIGYLESKAIFI